MAGGLVTAVLTYAAVRGFAKPGAPKADQKPVTLHFAYPLGEHIVNLNEPGRYLKATIELEITTKTTVSSTSPEAGQGDNVTVKLPEGGGEGETDELSPSSAAAVAEAKSELDSQRSKILDRVVEELSASAFGDLLLPAGKRELRERLQKAINSQLKVGKVEAVYFISFLAQ